MKFRQRQRDRVLRLGLVLDSKQPTCPRQPEPPPPQAPRMPRAVPGRAADRFPPGPAWAGQQRAAYAGRWRGPFSQLCLCHVDLPRRRRPPFLVSFPRSACRTSAHSAAALSASAEFAEQQRPTIGRRTRAAGYECCCCLACSMIFTSSIWGVSWRSEFLGRGRNGVFFVRIYVSLILDDNTYRNISNIDFFCYLSFTYLLIVLSCTFMLIFRKIIFLYPLQKFD